MESGLPSPETPNQEETSNEESPEQTEEQENK
jgi:hypothetical protein